MKRSLCIDLRMWGASGIGTYLRELVPRLESFFDLIVLVKKEEKKEIEQNIRATCISMNSSIYTVTEQFELSAKIPVCDLFWSPHYNIPLFKIKASKRVVTIHDVCHLANPHCFPRIKRILSRFLLAKALQKSDLILTDSLFSQGEINRFFTKNTKEIHPVFCGVSPKNSLAILSEVSSLGITGPFFLYVGSLKPHKNVERLVRAFKRLSDPSLSLILVGKGLLSVKDPRIKMLDKISTQQLGSLYTYAKALIHVSLYEGFGLTPLEAMSYGCPVVSSYFASLPEVCSKAALYVDPLSEESISQGMKIILENETIRRSLAQEGHKQVCSFSWDKTAIQIKTLFQKEIVV